MNPLTKRQMSTLDKKMVSMGIDIPVMMELAGFFTALKAAEMTNNRQVLVLSGTGNNGGDSLAAARHLLNWGYKTDIAFSDRISSLKPSPLRQWKTLKKMGLRETKKPLWEKYGLIIDGLLGYSANRNPSGKCAKLIRSANSSKAPVLSIDIPSGLDCTTGRTYEPCIKADETLTLSAPKRGLLKSKEKAGKISLAYMTIPSVIGKKLGIPEFSENKLIRSLKNL